MKEEKEIVVTLDVLWSVFKACALWMLIVALALGAAATVFSLATYEPEYTTTVSFYLANIEYLEDATNAASQYNNILLAEAAAEDCVYMLKLKEVKENACVSVGVPMSDVSVAVDMPVSSSSCIISIRVTASDARVAYGVANAVYENGRTLVKSASKLDMNIISHGELATAPSNSKISLLVPVSVFFGAAIVYVIFLSAHLFDGKINTPEDAEKLLGVSVLGIVPNRDRAEGKRYGKYYGKYYGRYYGADTLEQGTASDKNKKGE